MDYSSVLEKFLSWLLAILPKFLGAVAILLIGWWLCNIASRILVHALQRTKADGSVISFLGSLTKYSLKVIIFITAIAQFMDVTSIIAALGAAGVTVGLALKDSLSNVASGIQIIFTHPFRSGDYLSINNSSHNIEGTVSKIEIMYTTLTTIDNKEILIPNSTVVVSTIINYNAMDLRRLDLTYGIGYQDNISLAKQILHELVDNHEKIQKEPEPLIAVGEHRESCIAIVVKFWCKSEDYWPLYYEMQEQVKLKFDSAGIHIPYPQLDVHMISPNN